MDDKKDLDAGKKDDGAKKNTKVFVIMVLIAAFLFLTMPLAIKRPTSLYNATVNPNNGDIAFCYFVRELPDEPMRVSVYSKNGKELFSKEYDTSKVPYMVFIGDELLITVYEEGMHKKRSFDREGNETGDTKIPVSEITKHSHFENWEGFIVKKTYKYGDYEYCYEGPTPFNPVARLTITKGDTVRVLYESPAS